MRNRLVPGFGLLFLLLAGCSQDAGWYKLHPRELDAAMKNCPGKHPEKVSCEELAKVAEGVNRLGYEMQVDPQGFGKRILALEEELAALQIALKKNPAQPGLAGKMDQNRQKLTEYLAIVRWLQSPES